MQVIPTSPCGGRAPSTNIGCSVTPYLHLSKEPSQQVVVGITSQQSMLPPSQPQGDFGPRVSGFVFTCDSPCVKVCANLALCTHLFPT